MKLGFFTMPIHPLGKDWRTSLREDREAFLLADKLGFVEGYVGEHATDRAENITSCAIFIASLADATSTIKLGTGTINMPNAHPVATASQIAMLDHMLDGRFIFGISPGGLLSDAEAFGNLDADRNAMFVEAINAVLEIWAREPPYDIKGKYWTIRIERQAMLGDRSGLSAQAAAEAASADRGDRGGAVLQGRDRGGGARLGADLGEFPDAGVGQEPLAEIRRGLCSAPAARPIRRTGGSPRSIFVADDEQTAKAYATDPASPYRYYYSQLYTKLKKGRLDLFKTRRDQPDHEVTLDGICDELIIHGSPDKVADEILKFRERVGDFGTLLYAGKDWRDPALAKRSMILMAEKVLPKINAAIGTE